MIMMVMKAPPDHDGGPSAEPAPYPGEKARQGTIILRKPWQRAVFFAGLFGGIVLVLALGPLLAATA